MGLLSSPLSRTWQPSGRLSRSLSRWPVSSGAGRTRKEHQGETRAGCRWSKESGERGARGERRTFARAVIAAAGARLQSRVSIRRLSRQRVLLPQHALMRHDSYFFIYLLSLERVYVCVIRVASAIIIFLMAQPAKSVLTFVIAFVLFYLPPEVDCQQQQYFRIKPPSNVEVIQGTRIVLNCSVGSQSGAAQWSKNGFLLGQYNFAL